MPVRYKDHKTVRYGAVSSAHIAEPEADLELTTQTGTPAGCVRFAKESSASVDPIDSGTRDVVTKAFEVLIDKDGALQRCAMHVRAGADALTVKSTC